MRFVIRCLEDIAADRKTAAFAALASGVYAQIQKCRSGPTTQSGGSKQGRREVILTKQGVIAYREAPREERSDHTAVGRRPPTLLTTNLHTDITQIRNRTRTAGPSSLLGNYKKRAVPAVGSRRFPTFNATSSTWLLHGW